MPRMNRDRWTAILMLMPSIILLAIFVYGFIGRTAYISTTDWGGNSQYPALADPPVYTSIGFGNYTKLFTSLLNARFRSDLVNNLFFTLFFLLGCLGLGLLMAILIDQKIRGEGIFRTIFLFPMALSFVVTGTVWKWLFTQNGGLNALPTMFGLPQGQYPWYNDTNRILPFTWENGVKGVFLLILLILAIWLIRSILKRRTYSIIISAVAVLGLAGWLFVGNNFATLTNVRKEYGLNLGLLSVVIAAVWQMSGYTMAMYLAGLRGIPEELREAARVDGCSELQIYRHVILPLLQPITLSAAIILGHISLKIYDLVFVLAGKDNSNVGVPGISMYNETFFTKNFGLGSSIAMIMLIMVAFVIVPYLYSQLRSEVQR